MAGTLASLLVRIGADVSGMVSGMAQGAASVQRFGSQVSAVGARTSSMGRSMTMGVTLPIIGAGVAAIKTAADYEKTMNTMAAVAQVPKKGMQELDALAIKLGQDTIFSTQDAAAAMLELAKGGIKPAQIQAGALASTLDMAAAGDMELAQSATILSGAMHTFNLEGKDSARIADSLAGAANTSSADIGDLALALSQGGASAARFGLSIEETNGVLAMLADRGIKGSDAGTLLKSQLRTLVPVSAKAKSAMHELGIDFFDTQGRFIGLSGMAQELKEKLGPLSQETRELALNQIFGSDASRLAGIFAREGAEGLAKYVKGAGDAGAAAEVAQAKMKGLPGAIEQLKGSLETAMLMFGRAIAPTITKVAKFVTLLVNKFTSLPTPVKQGIAAFLGLAAAIGPVMFIVGKLISGVGMLISVVGFLLSPVGLVVAAIAGLVYIFVKLYRENEDFRNFVKAVWAEILSFAKQVWPKIQQIVSLAMKMVKAIVSAVVSFVSAVWRNYGDIILSTTKAVWNNVKGIIHGVLDFIKGIIQFFTALFKGDWKGMASALASITKGLASTLYNIIAGMANILKGIIQALGRAIWTLLKEAWNRAYEAVKAAIGWIVDFVATLPGKIMSALGDLGRILWNAGAEIIKGLLNGMKSAVGGVFDFVKGIPGKIIDLKGPLPKDKIMLVPAGQAIMDGLIVGMRSRESDLVSQLKRTSGMIRLDSASLTPAGVSVSGSASNGPGGDDNPTAGTAVKIEQHFHTRGKADKKFARDSLQELDWVARTEPFSGS